MGDWDFDYGIDDPEQFDDARPLRRRRKRNIEEERRHEPKRPPFSPNNFPGEE